MIVHGVLSLEVGGLERIVASMVRQQGSHVVAIERLGPLAEGLSTTCLEKPPGRHRELIATAEKLLRSLQATVLHTHQIGAAYYLAPAARKLGLRVIHTEHGNPFARARSWAETLKLRWLMRNVSGSIDVFATVSDEISQAITRWGTVPRSKVVHVPNGIAAAMPLRSRNETRKSLGITPETFLLGSVGRLHEVKRYHLLIESLPYSAAHLLLVGDGPEREALEAHARKLRVQNRVIFAGYQSEPATYLAAMDAFALSSRSEGFPVSVLEAWSLGVPVLAAAVGGLPGIITDGENGLLVNNHANPQAYADALARITPAIAVKGRHTWQTRYTLDVMLEQYAKLYACEIPSFSR